MVWRSVLGDHTLAFPVTSRRHRAFSVRYGRVWVEDLGSRHGTRPNGEPAEGPLALHDGHRLDLDCLLFDVRLSKRNGQQY
jgi:pSer/pThr/pTyr-binding forkhead associated (FHA) protein